MVAALFVVAGVALSLLGPGSEQAPASEALIGRERDSRPFVAVLPLLNLSGREEDAWFTDGMHGQILTQLYKIGSLGVISGTSVHEYRGSPKNLRTIGGELGARYIAEGDVLRAGNQVRVNIQLIDAHTDDHVWAESYDRPLSVENLLSIQTEIAQAVAGALRAALTADEERELERLPTGNLAAYDAYIRGNAYWETSLGIAYTEQSERTALQMFERAVELDPGFALAHAWVARLHLSAVYMGFGDREEQMALAREAVDRALELAPGLPYAHFVLGLYYLWLPDYDQMFRELAVAEQGLPGDAGILSRKAQGLWRMERWDEAISISYRSAALNPRSPSSNRGLARRLRDLRRYDEAEEYLARAVELQPDNLSVRLGLARIPWQRDGNPEPWRRWASDPALPYGPWVGCWRWRGNFSSRDYEAALEVLQTMDVEFETWRPYFPEPLLKGITHRFAGEPELAREAFDSARALLELRVREQPDDPTVRRALGLAYAGLGMTELAIREGQVVVELLPGFPVSEGYLGFEDWGFAWAYSLLGDDQGAIDQLETLLASPVGPSVNEIRADPWFDDLHDHPRFQALLERYREDVEH
jgi:TolB-like protein/Tfp pilus assembly protein PilF